MSPIGWLSGASIMLQVLVAKGDLTAGLMLVALNLWLSWAEMG